MGLPENFIKKYDEERKTDLFLALHYFASSLEEENDTGLVPHQHGSYISLVFQDEIDSLEVLKDGEWIPAGYEKGSIVVNVGDLLQVCIYYGYYLYMLSHMCFIVHNRA